MENLKELLKKCDELWNYNEEIAFTYNYTLGKFPGGWKFTVSNNWYNWSEKGLKHSFGVYTEPEYAIQAFLNYVRDNGIDVNKLADTTTKEEFDKIIHKFDT